MEIRLAGPGDARGIASVTVRAWRAAYRGIVPDAVLDRLSVDEREAIGRDMLADTSGGSFTLVALAAEGQVEGFCTVSVPSRDDDAGEGTAEVAATYVDPACWRQGIGGALLREVWAMLQSQGAWREATLWVLRANEGARSFYERFGFEPDGAAKVHERSGQEVVRMRTSLPTP